MLSLDDDVMAVYLKKYASKPDVFFACSDCLSHLNLNFEIQTDRL